MRKVSSPASLTMRSECSWLPQDRLSAGDVRNAAENAWWVANFAAKALIVARTGVMPLNFRDTGGGLGAMASSEPGVRDLSSRYYSLRVVLHEECYDSGMCEPIEGTVRLIRETADLHPGCREAGGT